MWAHLKDDDSVRPLTAILTLNTVAHTMGAAGVSCRFNNLGRWGVDTGFIYPHLAVLFCQKSSPKPWVLRTGEGSQRRHQPADRPYEILFLLIGPIVSQIDFAVLETRYGHRDDVAAMADLGEIEGALEVRRNRDLQSPAFARDHCG